MAKIKNNLLLHGVSGKLGKDCGYQRCCKGAENKKLENEGDKWLVTATDNWGVTKVSISFLDAFSQVYEQGWAESSIGDIEWVYEAAWHNTDFKPASIVVEAFYMPGNVDTKETKPVKSISFGP